MITYVNTVLVGKGTPSIVTEASADNAGKYIIMNVDGASENLYLDATTIADATRIKVGLITSQTTRDIKGNSVPVVKWSNIINKADIKSFNLATYTDDSPDTVVLDFTGVDSTAAGTTLALGNKRVLVRLTYKDMPTRYRKWTDTYEYVTSAGDTSTEIAEGLADIINKEWKRSRVTAKGENGILTLTALDYDDDDSVDSINVANKVRFSANAYYTDPEAAGFASKNKYSINGLVITRTPGVYYTASAKLVRDREAQAMGYEGILNRGEGTWPIIKPAMNTDLSKEYDALTLEFENMYRTADDLFRKTKQTVEIYDEGLSGSDIAKALETFVNGESSSSEGSNSGN